MKAIFRSWRKNFVLHESRKHSVQAIKASGRKYHTLGQVKHFLLKMIFFIVNLHSLSQSLISMTENFIYLHEKPQKLQDRSSSLCTLQLARAKHRENSSFDQTCVSVQDILNTIHPLKGSVPVNSVNYLTPALTPPPLSPRLRST